MFRSNYQDEAEDRRIRSAMPTWSVCSLGKQRWYWVVWRSTDALWNGEDPVTSGYATDRGAAEVAAIGAARSTAAAGQSVTLLPAGFAQRQHRTLAVAQRAARASTSTTAGTVEFVYSSWYSDQDDKKRWTRRRIVKKTKTRIYAEKRIVREEEDRGWFNTSYGGGQPNSYDVETFVLDRDEMERNGSAWSRSLGGRFYLAPEAQRDQWFTPPCFNTLELTLPCDATEVKRAYLRLSRIHHPDAGGDAAAFIALQSAYEEALAYVDERIAA